MDFRAVWQSKRPKTTVAVIWGYLRLKPFFINTFNYSHMMRIVENGLSRWMLKQPKIINCVSAFVLNGPKSQLWSF